MTAEEAKEALALGAKIYGVAYEGSSNPEVAVEALLFALFSVTVGSTWTMDQIAETLSLKIQTMKKLEAAEVKGGSA